MAGELVTGPGLIQWGTLLLGRLQAQGVTTPYRWSRISGWQETPGQDSGTTPRAQQSGAWLGRLLAQSRIITLEGLVVRAPRGTMGAVIGALEAATPIEQAVEQPLVVQLDERGPLLVFARVLRRATPPDPRWQLGYSEGGAIQWEATDPRRYSLTELSTSVGLPQPGQGLDWADGSSPAGLDWHDGDSPPGLDWGAAGVSGDLTVTNAGTAASHPVLEIRGPVTMPSITVQGTSTVLEYDLPLAASDVLTIDTRAGTVLLASGASRLYTVTARSVPENLFVLPPGVTTLSFRDGAGGVDPAASLTVRYRSAYW